MSLYDIWYFGLEYIQKTLFFSLRFDLLEFFLMHSLKLQPFVGGIYLPFVTMISQGGHDFSQKNDMSTNVKCADIMPVLVLHIHNHCPSILAIQQEQQIILPYHRESELAQGGEQIHHHCCSIWWESPLAD
jgi:hypothetical protein